MAREQERKVVPALAYAHQTLTVWGRHLKDATPVGTENRKRDLSLCSIFETCQRAGSISQRSRLLSKINVHIGTSLYLGLKMFGTVFLAGTYLVSLFLSLCVCVCLRVCLPSSFFLIHVSTFHFSLSPGGQGSHRKR